ncbi:putative reverse transcriptase domain-containing protein [Tanacetum coccineum]
MGKLGRNAQGWVYAVDKAEENGNAVGKPDSNIVTVSFISTAFSSLIDIIPTPLDNHYDVELADGKIVGVNTILRGCTLNFLNHPFTIDLMPVELGSFDAIIGMDWLRRHHAVIVCDEKLVRVPFGNETLVFRGAESYIGRESRLTVISCSKVQEYMAKGCHVFLAQISATKEDDKSEGKQVEDRERHEKVAMKETSKAIFGIVKEGKTTPLTENLPIVLRLPASVIQEDLRIGGALRMKYRCKSCGSRGQFWLYLKDAREDFVVYCECTTSVGLRAVFNALR